MPSGISSNFVLRIFWCKYGRNKSISQPNPHASFFPFSPAERDNKGRDGATRGGRPRAQAEATSQSHKTPRRKQAGHPLDERLSPQIPKCSFKLNSDQLPVRPEERAHPERLLVLQNLRHRERTVSQEKRKANRQTWRPTHQRPVAFSIQCQAEIKCVARNVRA